MMNNPFPQIEILPNQEPFNNPGTPRRPWYTVRRLIVFAFVFALSAIISLSFVYSRPALYRSYASLLTVAQTAIDQKSSEADIQHVTIQRQILTGQELLGETLTRLDQSLQENATDSELSSTHLNTAELRQMLTVEAVPETNLVELAAISYQAEILVPLINAWIDVYLERRSDEIRQTTGLTIKVLQEELAGLEAKIIIKRAELENFRRVNEITSLGRKNIFENQTLARFKGLNKSLNDASEAAVKAKARLDAVNKAISQGRAVVPREDKRGMQGLELRLQQLREQLADFDEKYTREYLALNPNLNVLPQQIKELEKEIRKKRSYGKSIVLTDAEQEYNAAKQALGEIKRQLGAHRQKATEFSSKFSEHESLLSDMEGLELLQRSTQERLAQIEAKQAEKFPQVKVIERAFFPREPFSPEYTRDAIIAVISSIVLGLLSVWIVEFLTRKEEQMSSISISGIDLYGNPAPGLNSHYQQGNERLNQSSPQALQHEQKYALELEQGLLRELRVNEIDALLEAADIKGKQLVFLLLSGLSLPEIAGLTREDMDCTQGIINIKGENSRMQTLNSALKGLFEHIEPCPAWNKNQQPVAADTLAAVLVYATADAGLTEPQDINAAAITHAYIIYLVKQGIRLSELENIFGYIAPTALSKYSRYSPEKRGLPAAEINMLYPSLARFID